MVATILLDEAGHDALDHTGLTGVGGGSGTVDNGICEGRLTLTTAVPVTTADVTAATSIFFTPFHGNRIATYTDAAWQVQAFTEKTLSLAGLAADTNHDVFIEDSDLTLSAVAWTNDTTRATALVLQDGVLVKSGDVSKRYLGTFRTTATIGQTEDSLLKRYLWNHENRVLRPLQVFDGTDTWTWNTAAWHQANAAAGNKVEYVCGVSEDIVRAMVQCGWVTTGANAGAAGIGVDATNANSAQVFTEVSGTTNGQLNATYRGWPGIGYHYLAWIEYARAGTMNFRGDNGVADMQSGLLAEILG